MNARYATNQAKLSHPNKNERQVKLHTRNNKKIIIYHNSCVCSLERRVLLLSPCLSTSLHHMCMGNRSLLRFGSLLRLNCFSLDKSSTEPRLADCFLGTDDESRTIRESYIYPTLSFPFFFSFPPCSLPHSFFLFTSVVCSLSHNVSRWLRDWDVLWEFTPPCRQLLVLLRGFPSLLNRMCCAWW